MDGAPDHFGLVGENGTMALNQDAKNEAAVDVLTAASFFAY